MARSLRRELAPSSQPRFIKSKEDILSTHNVSGDSFQLGKERQR